MKTFFMIIGVIATALVGVIVILALYFFGTRMLATDEQEQGEETVQESNSSTDHPYLTDEQEELLESYGIDISSLPTEITPGQESCAIEALGQERIQELMSGESPNAMDFLKIQKCF